MRITKQCPAKINLFLEVTGKLPNGYHELATLFAKVNLTDTLVVEDFPSATSAISLSVTGPLGQLIPAGNTNLVYQAAQRFIERFGITTSLKIHLEKHIPTGAGLGGGSSDAANTLVALCELFNKNKLELLDLAKELGADVPLFMFEDTFLKGEGIGEKLTAIPTDGKLPHLVLVYPNTVMPTKNVFKRINLPDEKKCLTSISNLDKLIMCLRCSSPLADWKKLLFNRLEEGVVPFTESVQKLLTDMKSLTNGGVMMSGSGSTVFALVETEAEAKALATKLQTGERTVFVTTFYRGLANENN